MNRLNFYSHFRAFSRARSLLYPAQVGGPLSAKRPALAFGNRGGSIRVRIVNHPRRRWLVWRSRWFSIG